MSQEKRKCSICQESKKKGESFKMDIFVCKKCLQSHSITEDGVPDRVFPRNRIFSQIVGIDYTITAFCHDTKETIELYPDTSRREIRREIR